MNVRVHHCLTRHDTIIETDGEPVWNEPRHELLAHPANQFPDCLLLIGGELEKRGDVPPGNDERVPLGDRKPVGKCHGVLRLQQEAITPEGAEWA